MKSFGAVRQEKRPWSGSKQRESGFEPLADSTAERKAVLKALLAENVVAVSPSGTIQGWSNVIEDLGNSPLAEHLTKASWEDRPMDDGRVMLVATLPAGAPVGALALRFSFDETGRITRIETSVTPTTVPEPEPVRITETMGKAINGALANGTPVVLAYVDDRGRPHLSFRGSTQVFDQERLAVWVRSPAGGLVAAVQQNAHVALLYRDPQSRTTYQFHGRASVSEDPAVADRVYANSPEVERNLDPQRRGVPLLIDVDRIEGRDALGAVLMTRAADQKY